MTAAPRASLAAWSPVLTTGGMIAAFLLLWGGLSGRVIDPYWVSDPPAVADRIVEWIVSGSIWPHIEVTASEVLFGLALGTATGVVAAVILADIGPIGKDLGMILAALYAVPRVALIPFFILVMGFGPATKLTIVSLTVFFLVCLPTYAAVSDRLQDMTHIQMRTMGATRWEAIRKYVLPSCVTVVLASVQLSVRYAIVAALLSETFASQRGLGYLLIWSELTLDTTGLLATVVIIVGLAVPIALLTRAGPSSIFARTARQL